MRILFIRHPRESGDLCNTLAWIPGQAWNDGVCARLAFVFYENYWRQFFVYTALVLSFMLGHKLFVWH